MVQPRRAAYSRIARLCMVAAGPIKSNLKKARLL
jgi:hypothetical protein